MTKFEPLPHDDARALLPWLVNDSLSTTEREQVEAHANACIVCRRELEDLEKLRASVQHVANSSRVPELDMQRINARIDAMLLTENRLSRAFASVRELFRHPWRLAFVAQSVVIVGLVVFFFAKNPEPVQFTTLTSPELLAPEGNIRVVFDPDLDADAIANMLKRLELDLVSGPSERGVATLRSVRPVNESSRDELLSQLLDQPGVLFAVPLSHSEP